MVEKKFTAFKVQNVSKDEFINFWSCYYKDSKEHLYTDNISKPLDAEKIHKLYTWKNGSELSKNKYKSVRQNYVERLDELNTLPDNTTPSVFLDKFNRGGAIWRIYWLHCWKPYLYPIYDMHAHRAMAYFDRTLPSEISNLSDKKKIHFY